MSNNAGGLPHAVLSTAHPWNIGIGDVEAQWIWGRLQKSDWFEPGEDSWLVDQQLTRKRFITGAVVSFRPRGLKEMTLGAGRVFTEMVAATGLGAGGYFLVLLQRPLKVELIDENNPTGEDARDQILSLFWRWAKPGNGFESYLEWARNDHAYGIRNAVLEPEHSQGYTIGARQAVSLSGNRVLTFQGELTHLEKPSTRLVLDYAACYAHYLVPQGYTQRGQVLGGGQRRLLRHRGP